jgi:hypothetical protein
VTAEPLTNWFHQAVLAIGFIAAAEGWLHDSERVKRVVYHLYEYGELPAHPGSLTPLADGVGSGSKPRSSPRPR